jgi:hypothetical protein
MSHHRMTRTRTPSLVYTHRCSGRYRDRGQGDFCIASALHEAGHVVSIVNPAQILDFARTKLGRNKTDGVDASHIREYCELFKPQPWAPASVARRSLAKPWSGRHRAREAARPEFTLAASRATPEPGSTKSLRRGRRHKLSSSYLSKYRLWQSPALMAKTSSAAARACATGGASAASGRCPVRNAVVCMADAAQVP